MLTKAQGMQMSPLKSQMACFTQHCLTKPLLNQPRSCLRVQETTAFLLPSSSSLFLLPPSSHFFLHRPDVHTSRNSENWTFLSFYLVSASANHCENAHSYIHPQQRHLHHGPASTQTITLRGRAMVLFTNSKVCDIQVCIGDGVP